MQLSIIVPVYQVEQYIRPCLESIFRQGLDELCFEVILVNDGTRDNSMGVIQDILSQHQNILIVEQSNQGLSVARNRGMEKATGKYILFLDSDDLLVEDTLAMLLDEALKKQPDMLIADFIKMDDKKIEQHQPIHIDRTFQTTSATDLFLYSLNPRECYVWHTLYHREFLLKNQLRFIPDLYFEDIPFTTGCYLKARTCVKSTCVFYIYRQRPQSICSFIDIRKIYDLNTIISLLWDMQSIFGLTHEQVHKIREIAFATFSLTLWYITEYQNLFAARKQLVSDIKQKIPHLIFTDNIKQYTVSILFRFIPYTYIYLRRMIHRLVKRLK